MSPRNEVFHAIPFGASNEANEPLIATGDAEEEKSYSCFKKFSALLLGFLVGFFVQFSILKAIYSLIALWEEDSVSRSKTYIVVFSLLWSSLSMGMANAILVVLCHLVTIAYSAVGGRSKELLEDLVSQMECNYFMGTLVCAYLASTM